MNEAPRTDEADMDAAAVGRDAEQMLPLLVAHLREHRTRLRQEWATRIHDAYSLEAMSPQERALETTTVYDNYVEVLEAGSVEALQQFVRHLSERIVPRGVGMQEVLGIVLQLHDVLVRSLFEKYQRDFGLLNRVLDAYEPVANRIAKTVAFSFVDARAPDPAHHRRLGHRTGTTTDRAAADPVIALEVARGQITNLNQALRTRTTIGEALGLLMHERTITADAAFAHLVEVSSRTNVKIREIAALMVEEANSKAERARAACSMPSRRLADGSGDDLVSFTGFEESNEVT